jgi:hypothetical protein
MIEPLEARIAPAAIVSFTETDGDKITVQTSKGTKAQLEDALNITKGATGISGFTLDLIESPGLAAAFAGSVVTISAVKTGAGDGLADQVKINASSGGTTDIDLKKVTIKGNLVSINVGDAEQTTKALSSLVVTNFVQEKGNPAAIPSQIRGDIGSVRVTKEFNGFLTSLDPFTGPKGTVINSFFAGAIAREVGDDVGHIRVGEIKNLTVVGRIEGTPSSTNNGVVEATLLGKISLGGMSSFARIVLS